MPDLERLNIDTEASFEDANNLLYRLGVTDGLPVVPPTEARVAAMVGERDPSRKVATLPPMQGQATVRGLAICAVMAGCRPDEFDVLQAATAAVADPAFNLFGIQTTTGTVAPLLIVNGPVIQRLGLNTAANALGPGTRANATIGRALQFVLRAIGGAQPGRGDKATMGQPGKFTFCCAENALASPWESAARLAGICGGTKHGDRGRGHGHDRGRGRRQRRCRGGAHHHGAFDDHRRQLGKG